MHVYVFTFSTAIIPSERPAVVADDGWSLAFPAIALSLGALSPYTVLRLVSMTSEDMIFRSPLSHHETSVIVKRVRRGEEKPDAILEHLATTRQRDLPCEPQQNSIQQRSRQRQTHKRVFPEDHEPILSYLIPYNLPQCLPSNHIRIRRFSPTLQNHEKPNSKRSEARNQ